jgi:hypothetical protein
MRAQQRTSRSRQVLRSAIPSSPPSVVWQLLGVLDNVVSVRLLVGGQALIQAGVPKVRIAESERVAVGFTGAGEFWELAFAEPVPAGSTVVWPQEDPALRTALGGYIQGFDLRLPSEVQRQEWEPLRPSEFLLVLRGLAGSGAVAVDEVSTIFTSPGGFAPVSFVTVGSELQLTYAESLLNEIDVTWDSGEVNAIYVNGKRPVAATKGIN